MLIGQIGAHVGVSLLSNELSFITTTSLDNQATGDVKSIDSTPIPRLLSEYARLFCLRRGRGFDLQRITASAPTHSLQVVSLLLSNITTNCTSQGKGGFCGLEIRFGIYVEWISGLVANTTQTLPRTCWSLRRYSR